MGKTSKPVVFMVHDDDIAESQAMADLIAKGHTMIREGFTDECDVEIGRKCYKVNPKMRLGADKTDEESLKRQLEMVIEGVRNEKYPKEKKNAKAL